MGRNELRKMAGGLIAQARAVRAAYPRETELEAIALSDPTRSAQSFGNRTDELRWYDLIAFHATILSVKQRDIDAFCELPRQIPVIEAEYGLAE
jgi:hypothetical protein